ncbi:MAG: putative molybdenum carrier protein [Pirellulaceae bacterium]|nr:putative molybdenum carrier protein [Pirellulaceae bacterium]
MPARESRPLVERLVSGGQTGVDRAALDVALRLGLDHGGWCPRGRLAEDGSIPAHYRLRETRSRQYRVRTERNVMDSDGTLILYRGTLKGGTLLTRRLAGQYGKPCLVVDLGRAASADDVVAWLVEARIRTLNVAGPRESTSPGIFAAAEAFLLEVLGRPAA